VAHCRCRPPGIRRPVRGPLAGRINSLAAGDSPVDILGFGSTRRAAADKQAWPSRMVSAGQVLSREMATYRLFAWCMLVDCCAGEVQIVLYGDGYGFPGFFGVVAQPLGSPAAADGTGEFPDKSVSFGLGTGGPLGVVVGVGLGDVVIEVAQPGMLAREQVAAHLIPRRDGRLPDLLAHGSRRRAASRHRRRRRQIPRLHLRVCLQPRTFPGTATSRPAATAPTAEPPSRRHHPPTRPASAAERAMAVSGRSNRRPRRGSAR